MITFLTVIHIVVALVLIFFVLLQDPKGGGAMGVFGGGGSNTLFGSTGANNFFTQVTKGAAILFAVLCVTLTYLISHQQSSVLDGVPAAPPPAKMAPDTVPPAEPAPTPPTK
jgi:preprotein translocase subunit SecG